MSQVSVEHRQQLERIFTSCPLVPVITVDDPDTAVDLGRALVAGGLRILEITLRTNHGLTAISALRAALPDAWVGAGTVTNAAQYQQAEAAGAQFVISPGSTESLLDYGVEAKVPFLPGVATLSEVMRAHALGYRDFKFFPAEAAGGIEALKAFGGPFRDIRFCPTGGIRPDTAANYLALGNVLAVGGSWFTPRDLVESRNWEAITRLAADSLARC